MKTFTTRRDPHNVHTHGAILLASLAHDHANMWSDMVTRATSIYGDAAPDGTRTLTAGVYRAHFPAAVKEQLRNEQRARTAAIDESLRLWRAAGRTLRTWRIMFHGDVAR